ncbi:MAG: hypothetical protein WBF75_00175 [Pseudonocardiaceae bacterium]
MTKVLAREANQLLQPALPRSQWADMLIADLVDSDAHVLRAPHFRRRARGLAKFHYPPLQLTDDELAEARHRFLSHQAASLPGKATAPRKNGALPIELQP